MHFPDSGIAAKSGIIRSVEDFSRAGRERSGLRFYLGASLAALALRLFLVFRFPAVVDDSRLYADIAKNWLQHGIYAITNSGRIMPTLSRLPGYPAFLAAVFTIFGLDNFRAVLLIQVAFDLATCFLIADMARRLFSEPAARAAFLLAALCPFLANYAATALTETLEIFFTALALDLVFRGLEIGGPPRRSWLAWLGCGLAIAGAILLRPDGGILLAVIGAYLLWLLVRSKIAHGWNASPALMSARILLAGVLVAIGALAPLIPWTLRNLHTFHRFQPLAPRYANDSEDPVMAGFNRWVKTWTAEYVSVEEIYWNVPGEDIDINRLPRRAFDSPQQRELTAELFDEYNRNHDLTPELDARFGKLASQRIHASPLRYYVWLPLVRITDMWLRPRTELFPSDPRWWEFNDDPRWLTLSIAFGVINLIYLLMAAAGLVRARAFFGIGLFVLFLLVRSLFLGSLENPEPRYTLEMYPAVIVLASALFHRRA
ncbi:MAG TPA: glycosyltransferase family 39 protein [Candidatus Acidoferrales bacterium]|nr:glycosyltransferase family 39 protein [Candidatus Acidoferrales bacterium]